MFGGTPPGTRTRGAYHRNQTKFPALSAQQTPTQGHDNDLGRYLNVRFPNAAAASAGSGFL